MSMRYLAGVISAFYNPLKVPDAPTIGTATAASSVSVSVTFTAPSNVGGGAITSYIATARKTSDGTVVSTTGPSSPIVVTGLTASTAYTVTVVAVNLFGPSFSSATSNSVTTAETPPTVIGQSYGGGYYAGQISTAGTGVADYYLIIGPKTSAEIGNIKCKTTDTSTPGTTSVIDGPGNSSVMNSAIYPAAQFCEGLVIGGYSDWYMPAKNELEVCYYNLKPTTSANNTGYGVNLNAVPYRNSNYTAAVPAQTSAVIFQAPSGAENLNTTYWTSTEFSATKQWTEYFSNGYQSTNFTKANNSTVRAVRRVAV